MGNKNPNQNKGLVMQSPGIIRAARCPSCETRTALLLASCCTATKPKSGLALVTDLQPGNAVGDFRLALQASRKPRAACECCSIASSGIMNPVIWHSGLVLVHTQGRPELRSKAAINSEQCLSSEILTILVLSDLQIFFQSDIPLG